MTTDTTPTPPRPPREGYYWQLDPCGWREVRPVNWPQLGQYNARIASVRAQLRAMRRREEPGDDS